MHIISDPRQDIRHPKSDTGAYEWWYFDAHDPSTDTTVVVIFFDGLLFSPAYQDGRAKQPPSLPADHPGIQIAVYRGGETLFYALSEYEPCNARFGGRPTLAEIGRNRLDSEIDGNRLRYILHLDEALPAGNSIQGRLVFESGGSVAFGETKGVSAHSWNLVQPKAAASGSCTLRSSLHTPANLQFGGFGYHDHNLGHRPLHHDFKEWNWGRVHFPTGTLVWYLMEGDAGPQSCAWFVPDTAGGEVSVPEALECASAVAGQSGRFGLASAGHIELVASAGDCRVTLRRGRVWDDGPFYQRFRMHAVMEQHGEVERAEGLGEFIRADRIEARWSRPLVRMRLTRQGRRPHWVQRSPRLYRLTW